MPQVEGRITPGNEPAERTDLTLGREFDNDRFASIPPEPEPEAHAVEPSRPKPPARDNCARSEPRCLRCSSA